MAHRPSCIRVWEPAGSCVRVSPWPAGLSTQCGRVELGLKNDGGPEGELGPAAWTLDPGISRTLPTSCPLPGSVTLLEMGSL